MSARATKTMSRYLERLAREFRDDRRGLAAVEFAMIVPLMMVLLFGMIEITNGVAVNRKVYLVARTLSDLTSRNVSVQTVDVTSFFTVGETIMQPYEKTPLVALISEIYVDPSSSNGVVQWSQASKVDARLPVKKKGDVVTVPAGLISKDSSGKVVADQYLILSQVIYLYTPVVGYVMNKAGVTLSSSTFTRPRQSDDVAYNP